MKDASDNAEPAASSVAALNLLRLSQMGDIRIVREEADKLGVAVVAAEIVGLLPRAALDREASYFPFLENFREALVLETLFETPQP